MKFDQEIKILEARRKKNDYAFTGNPAFAPIQRRVEIHPKGVTCVDVILKSDGTHEWNFIGAVAAKSWQEAVEKSEPYWSSTPSGSACRLLCWHPAIRWESHENSKKHTEESFADVVRSNTGTYKIGDDDYLTVFGSNLDTSKTKTNMNILTFALPPEMKAKINEMGNVFVESAALALAAGAVPAVLHAQSPDEKDPNTENGSCLFVCGDGANLLFICFREGEIFMSRKVSSTTNLHEVTSTIDAVGGSSAFIAHFSIVGGHSSGGIPLIEEVGARGTFKVVAVVSTQSLDNIPAEAKPTNEFIANNFIPMASYASSL